VGKAIAVRDATHTYVYRQCESDELYDRIEDPAETRNRIAEPELAPVRDRLRSRLLDWLVATSDTIPWDPHPRFPDIPHGRRDRHGDPASA
jgi:hypothetical protein